MTPFSLCVSRRVSQARAPVTRIAMVTAALAGALLLWGCTRTATLYNPPRIAFFQTDTVTVERAIMEAMNKAGWAPSREAPGVLLGTLHLRAHTAVVRIEYTSDSYRITHVRSDNLNYARRRDGSEIIHPNYNAWVQNLVKEISARLLASRQ